MSWDRQRPQTEATQERARQYASREHRQARKAAQREVDAGTASCWRCGCRIAPGTPWHLGHDDHDRTITRGVECVPCNLKAAARKGNALARAAAVPRPPRAQSRNW